MSFRIHFGLPNDAERGSIFKRYAKQLSKNELASLVVLSSGLSGRDIKEVCLHAERKFASLKLRGLAKRDTPAVEIYRDSVLARVRAGNGISQV